LILDEVTRDYVYSIKDEKLRKAKLIPWLEDEIDQDDLCESDPRVQNEPTAEYFV
jgi:predicted Mrr-cat superfamily restriction endonuclease